MEKRVRFRSAWLPWLLIAPQMAIVLVFFFWPAGQALWQSVLQQDAFGTSTEFVGLENFRRLWADESYLASFKTTAVFSLAVAVTGLSSSLLLAVMADRVVKGARFYKQNPGTDVSVTQMIRKTTDKSRGVRLGNFVQIRTIIDEELEGVWAGKKPAKDALETAIKRGNEQLERFEKSAKL